MVILAFMENVIAAIDIWSSRIKTVIGVFNQDVQSWTNDFNVLGVWISESNAIRKGNILDMEEFKKNVEDSLLEAEKMSGEQMVGAFLTFNSSSLEVMDNKGVIAVTWDEISYADVERALDMAKSGVELPNREVVKVIPDTFTVDIEQGIKSPIGMSGRKLEVKTNIFSFSVNVLNNIKKAVTDIWVEIYDIYPSLISAPEGVLNKRQKELWVCLVDIWASTTWITVYEEGTLKYSKVIPIGWESVTNDIAIGLRTTIDIAERLKVEHGDLNVASDDNYKDQDIDLAKYYENEEGDVSKKFLSQISEARYREILYFIKDELKKIGKDGMLPEWVVLVWGASKMAGLPNFVKEVLRLPVQVGLPLERGTISETSISDPSYAWVIGTLILAKKYSMQNSGMSLNFNFKWIFDSFSKLIKKLLP